MAYADYIYYAGTYHGQTIQDDEWPALAVQSSAHIDRFTFGRLKRGAPVTDDVRMAVCAVADVVKAHKPAGNIQREDVDGYSVTYENAADTNARFNAELLAAIDLYLSRGDPLRFAGVG